MLFTGDRLPEAIPTDTSVWHWLFDDALPNSPFNRGRAGGFRDARTDAFLSYARVRTEATHLATALTGRGLRAGHHVVLFLHNTIWYPVVTFAALRQGAVVTASSPEYAVDEMAHVLATAEADLVFADGGSWGAVEEAAKQCGLGVDRIVLLGSVPEAPPAVARLDDLLAYGAALPPPPAWTPPPGTSNATVPAFLSFTSGTTSRPKGVLLSHHNVLAQLMQMRALTAAEAPSTLLAVLPFYHITGVVQLLQLPLALNQHVVCMDKFQFQEMLAVVERYQCDELWLVPPLLIRLVHDPAAAGHTLPFARQFNTGAAPLAREIVAKLAARFPHVRLRQAWGMTESCSALTLSRPAEQTYALAHTVGRPVPETTLKIIDPDYEGPGERVLSAGQSGEVLARGPQVAMGYYRAPAATAETFDAAGFLHTGDIGFVDGAGLLHIHDRRKEMVKVKGVAVAPAELENLLLGHAAVADVAVVGVPDAYAGERLKAYVVLHGGAARSPETATVLADYVKQTKSRPKWLTGGVVFVDAIPKSASGKVLRRVLKEAAVQEAKQDKAKL